jgi:hypothetical protein
MMTNSQAQYKKNAWALLTIIAVLLLLIPWFLVRAHQAANSDALWLAEAMERVLRGHSLSQSAYEFNPPLSMILYFLPVVEKIVFHLPLHHLIFAQTVLAIFIGTFFVYKILRSWPKLAPETAAMVAASYCLVMTLCPMSFFGERDHYIAIALLPFVLMQVTLTGHHENQGLLKWFVFIPGSLMILLKPHFGLIPTIMLLHRVIRQKNLSVLRDADFLSLAFCTLAYIALLCGVFPDYVSKILLDSLILYASLGGWGYVAYAISYLAAIAIVIFLLLSALPKYTKEKELGFLFLGLSLLNLIPVYVQGMGFYYHLIPAIGALLMGLTMLISETGKSVCLSGKPSAATTILVLAAILYVQFPLNPGGTTHDDYKNLPLTKSLRQECPKNKPCSFYMFNRDAGLIFETAYYAHVPFASRFMFLWPFAEIVESQKNISEHRPSRFTAQQTEELFTRFVDMLAEDLARNKPDIVYVWKSGDAMKETSLIQYHMSEKLKFDYIKVFSRDKAFRDAWSHYRKTGSLQLNYGAYYKGMSTEPIYYDIYHLRP